MSSITPINGPAPSATSASQPGAGGLSSMSSQDFLDLLVAQIQNQDPLNPVSSSQFMAQTSELSTLEQITALSQKTSQVLAAQQLQTAVASIGHTITGTDSSGQAVSGTVKGVQDTSSGPLLDVGSAEVPVANVTTID